jgi:hypothetical protein
MNICCCRARAQNMLELMERMEKRGLARDRGYVQYVNKTLT